MKVGYIQPTDQNEIDSQVNILKKAGCEHIFYSEEYRKMFNNFKNGDILIVKSLRSLDKTTRELIKIIGLLTDKNAALQSIEDDIFINGGLTARILSIFLEAGTTWGAGRPKGLLNSIKMIKKAQELWAEDKYEKKEIAQKLGITRPTLDRYLKVNIRDII